MSRHVLLLFKNIDIRTYKRPYADFKLHKLKMNCYFKLIVPILLFNRISTIM